MTQRYFSTIYWHFTGSPQDVDWSLCRRPKDILNQGCPKSPEEALNTLFKILDTTKLRATSTEKISERLHTQPFCCVTDIPLMDLELHSRYYGKVAIGFSHDAIYFNSFTPVLYYSNNLFPRKSCVPDYTPEHGQQLIVDDFDEIDRKLFEVEEQLPDGRFRLTLKGRQMVLFGSEIDSNKIDNFFANYIKITDFSSRIGHSFYQEREWRHIGDFCFTHNCVEALIVPKRHKKKLMTFLSENEKFKDTCVLTWEFLKSA